MKRLLIILCFGLSAFVATAQPELYVEDATLDPGDEICVPVRGRFFTDIVTIQFSVNFDATQLDFLSVGNFGIGSMSNADFDLSQAANGIITFSWRDSRDCQATNGGNPAFTIENDAVLFDICFRAKVGTSYGDAAVIDITGTPLQLVTERLGSFSGQFGCRNLGFLNIDPGLITVSVRPVQVEIAEEVGNAGDLVCVNFAVKGFDNLESIQFNVLWDSTVMELENVVPNDNIPNNGLSNFGFGGNTASNRLIYNWFYTSVAGEQGITLDDGTQLFQLCFRLLDDSCEKTSNITIVDFENIDIQVTNTTNPNPSEFLNIFFESNVGSVTANACDPQGVQVNVVCGPPVNLNEQVCVEVQAGDNYFRISALDFLMKWNPSILQFNSVQNFAPGWKATDFVTTNSGNGTLGVAWDRGGFPPPTLTAGDIIFEVCYDVIGLGGNSPVNISTPWRGISGNEPNFGINPTNCEVVVNQPEGVTLSVRDGAAGPGDTFCVDVDASSFTDITSMEFSMVYDPSLFQLANVGSFAIPSMSAANFTNSGASGSLFFEWNDPTGADLPDQATIFQMCFTPLGDPGDCSALDEIGIPRQPRVTNSTSNGDNIGLTITSGELCTLFPDGFGLNIQEDAVGDWLDTACVAVSIIEFNNISGGNFCFSWDAGALEYTGINFTGAWDGLTEANVDASSAGVGLLCFDWTGDPTTIPDATDVFELCFKMVGEALECYDIDVVKTPAPTATTANGPGSVIGRSGSLCVNDKLYIIDTLITPASCPGTSDGSVEITVIGGQGQLGTVWFTEPNNQFNPRRAVNLAPGPLTFRISDNNSPNLVQEFTIEIPLADGVPIVDAGVDKLLGCDPQSVLLSGVGSEGNFSYEWFRVTDAGQQVSIGTNRSVVEFVAGQKIFTVTNNETTCTSSDTMFVTAPTVPTANAGTDLDFTCNDGIQLDGSGSQSGPNIVYSWMALNNGIITEGQDSLINPQIEAPGSYILKTAFEDTGCFSTDTVRVIDATVVPDVVAGQDKILDCSIGTVTLQSLGNNPGLSVTYEWYDQNNQLVQTGETFQTNQLGTYVLLGRENTSNCTTTDTVMVLPDENYPSVLFDQPLTITCIRDTVMLSATVGPDSIDYTFTWTASGGGQLVPLSDTSLTPLVVRPGTYTLAVTNTASSCTAEVDIVVAEDKTPPVVAAGADQAITCQESSVTLDGSGSDTGADFTYIWTNSVGDTIGTAINADVSIPGTYTLEVTSLVNGCTATDQVNVILDENVPQITIAGAQDLTCELTTLNLNGSVIPAGPAYQFQWFEVIGGDAFNPIGDNTANLTVDQAGVYMLEATNPLDGCVGNNQVTINLNNQLPTAEAGDPTQSITCDTVTVTLSAEASSQGPTFTYEWSNVAAPQNTNQVVTVSAPNTYVLTVRNTETGCEATDMVEVVDGQQPPALSFSNPNPAIDCINTSIELEGVVQGATDLTVSWSGLTGGTPSPTDALQTTVTAPGNYRMIVENNLTGCVDSLDVTVADNTLNPPVVSIAEPIPFTCTTPFINLDASATGVLTDFSSISWVSTDGNTVTPPMAALQVQVDGPGNYQLTVVDATTGCSGVGTVTVVPDNATPVAMAGADTGIECDETGVLDATASSQGAAFSYEWVNLDGGAAPAPANDLEPAVDVPASYLLIVTNADNGCVDTDTIVVSRIFPPDAAAGTDVSLCRDETTTNLSANIPTGTTGMWTTQGTAVTDGPTLPTTGVSALQEGANVFTWTLSAPGCPDYSQDQVTVFIETAPIPVEDLIVIESDPRSATIDLARNDVLTNVDEYSVTLMGAPEFGTIDSFVNGRVFYSVPSGFVGTTIIPYEICNLDCPDLCATGSLRIVVSDPDFEPTIMNTITPNGDGLNDNLIFDVLQFTPAEEFPDNEIIIFNRWGDIVFEQRPYNNEWGGLNNNGQELPQGTYYYILRLNLADGIILRGDITIIK